MLNFKCKKIQKQLIAYLKSELPAKDMERIVNHLKHCPNCNQAINDLRAFYQLINDFQPVSKFPYPEEDFLIQVHRRIRTLPSKPKVKVLTRLIPVWASAMVVLVIITILVLNKIKPQPTADEILFTSLNQSEINATYLYDNLDQKTQELINAQLIAEVFADEIKSFDQELFLSAESVDLFSQLSDMEKENVINELIKKYFNEAKSLGGKNG